MTTSIFRAASKQQRLPAPRQAASLLTSFALVAAGLGVAAGLQLATAASGTVTGTVFEDYDQDGVHDAREPGVVDVVVTAVDADGNRTRDVRTDGEGTYEIDLGVVEGDDLGAGPYRIEFSAWPSHLEEGPVGPDSGSSIQFVEADSIDVSLGLAAPSDYCQDNPDVVGACFVYAGLDSADSWPTVVSVGWDWTDNNSTSNPNGQLDWMRDGASQPVGETVLATVGDTGAVWGEAWDRENGVFYVGAFVKRHTALGPTGNPTTIYRIDTNNTPRDTSDDTIGPWITVDPSAPDPHSGATDGWHADYEAFDAVYQSGLGDVEISRDGSTIYTIDLRNKTLVAIPIEDDGSAGTPTTISIVNRMGLADGYTPNEGSCAHADLQPAGLGVDADGRVHVGVVCTAASTITKDGSNYDVDGGASNIAGWDGSNASLVPGDPFALHGYVVEWDGQAGGSFTPVIDFRLDGARGCVAFGTSCPFGGDSEWRPWIDHYPYVNDEDTYSQPVVTDIDFDNDAMIVALADRWGHQTGPETRVRKVDGSTQRFRHPVAGGDLLRTCANGDGTYTMEGEGGCPVNRSSWGEDEFFFDDRYRGTHLETGQGSVAIAPGFDQLIHTQMDPVNAGSTWRSGGFAWTDPDTGEKDKGLRIYDGRNHTPVGTFEKASGIGDVELMCDSAPLTIGNRVWLDLDGDGVQDADEPGIDGVVVTLLDAGGATVTSMTTGADATGASGSWAFAIDPGAAYTVTFDAAGVTGLPLGITADELQLTSQAVGDTRTDSDADENGEIAVAPLGAGENDHTLDVGFVPVPATPALDIEKLIASENGTGALIDADSTGDGAGIAWYLPGVTATYEIRVTNTGEVDLVDVVVTDPLLPDCASTIDSLAIDATTSWQCTLVMPAQTSFVNAATASITWTPPYGSGKDTPQTISDTDDAVARIVNPAIDITKSAPTAAPYAFGDDVTYTYQVTNTGDVDLDLGTPARLSDDTCSSITGVGSPNIGDLDADGILDVEADITGVDDGAQEVWAFTCTTTVDEADLDAGDPSITITNIVDVTGTPVTPDGSPTGLADVTARDDETITVYDPAIQIETQVKDPVTGAWRNADSLDGETGEDAESVAHHVDSSAEYRYVVTNTGNVALASLTLTDSGTHVTECGLPRTPADALAPGASLTIAGDDSCWSGTLTGAGSVLLNTGRIVGTPVDGDGDPIVALGTVSDTDPATIHLIEAAIAVEKVPALQTLARGGDAAWTFEVTNVSTGVDELEKITIDDVSSIGLECTPAFVDGDTDDDGKLDADETWNYACSVAGVIDSGEDTVTVTGDVPTGTPTPSGAADPYQVTDSDDAEHQVGKLTIAKWVRIADLNAHTDDPAAPGPWTNHVTVQVDDMVDFRIVAANFGDAPLTNVVVADDQCTLALFEIDNDTSGSADQADQLAVMSVGETWEYRCSSSSATEGTITNIATMAGDVVANPEAAEDDMVAGDSAWPARASARYTTVEPSLSVYLYWPGLTGEIDADGDAGTVGSNDPTPPVHLEGDELTAVIVVTNTGTTTLHDVFVTHDLDPTRCVTLAGTLTTMEPGDTYLVSCELTAGSTGAGHIVSASASWSSVDGLALGAVVPDADDQDAASYVVASIDLVKQVVTSAGLFDADTVLDAAEILEGNTVTWRLTATNTGEVDLVDVEISDPIDLDGDSTADCGPFVAADLPVGASVSFDCTTGPVNGDVANTGRVDAQAPDPANGPDAARSVDDTDPAHVRMIERASLGDRIWHDVDGDGLQGAGEPGLGDITVELLDGTGSPIASTTTDADGYYGFIDLEPGVYQIRVTVPDGWVVVGANQGMDDAIDSDLSGAGLTLPTTLDPGEDDLSIDGGLYQPASIGDRVWYDANGDGIQDDGEVGIEGVGVSLLDGDGQVLDVRITDADGDYLFADLVPGTYSVLFSAPEGMTSSPQNEGENDDIDSDADGDGATLEVVLISGSAVRDRDAGFYEPAAIGNLVWIDADEDGFQDEDEQGVADVTVRLLDENGDLVATTVTDHAGRYLFENLPPGMYQIEVVAPSGMTVTDPDLDPGDLADSDIDAGTSRTPMTELEAGEIDQSWDAGLVIPTVVLSTPNDVSTTPELAFTGATVVGLAAGGVLLIGFGGTARILSDRVRRRPTAF